MASVNFSADAIAADLLARTGLDHHPPIDVEELARRLGVSQIVDADIVEDGRLEIANGKPTIYLRDQGTSLSRRRFTIAHEIAHLALGLPGEAAVAWRRSATSEERACDEIAASILIPRRWLALHFANRTHNLSSLRHVAHKTNVSLSAGLVRCREVLGWRESLLRWSLDDGKWRYLGEAGVPASIHAKVRSAPATSESLDGLRKYPGDRHATIPLIVGGRETEVEGQFDVGRSRAIGLVRLSDGSHST